MYYLIIDYQNGITQVKSFKLFERADKYLNKILKTKFTDVMNYKITYGNDGIFIK